jgi:HK97 family phage major capsid protein
MSDVKQIDNTPAGFEEAVGAMKALTTRLEAMEKRFDQDNGDGAAQKAKQDPDKDPMAPFQEQMESLEKQVQDMHAEFQKAHDANRADADPPERKGAPQIADADKGGFSPAASLPNFSGKKYGWANPAMLKHMAAMPTAEVKQVMGAEEYAEFEQVMDLADRVYLLNACMNSDFRNPTPIHELKLWQQLNARVKALDTATSGEGAEWIPTGFSSRLIDRIDLQLVVAPIFPRFTMPTNPFTIPVEGGHATPYLVAENTGDTGQTKVTVSTPGTQNVTLDARTIGARTLASYEIEEDSIIPILPFMQRKLTLAIARGIDDALVNGDTAGTHQDSDVTGATDRRKAWDGLRKLTLTAAKQDLSTFTVENIRNIRSKMGKYAANPADNSWIVGVQGHILLLSLKDSANNPVVITMDKLGSMATILTGMIGSLDGSPVLISEFMREDVNASGVYDGSTTDKKLLALVNRPSFTIGDRRRVLVETDRDIEEQQHKIVASWRGDFESYFDTTTEKVVGQGNNF